MHESTFNDIIKEITDLFKFYSSAQVYPILTKRLKFGFSEFSEFCPLKAFIFRNSFELLSLNQADITTENTVTWV